MRIFDSLKAEAKRFMRDESGVAPLVAAAGITAIGGLLSSVLGGGSSSRAPAPIPPSEEELALIRAQTALINPQAAYLMSMLPAQETADRYELFLQTGDMSILNTGNAQDGSVSTPGADPVGADGGSAFTTRGATDKYWSDTPKHDPSGAFQRIGNNPGLSQQSEGQIAQHLIDGYGMLPRDAQAAATEFFNTKHGTSLMKFMETYEGQSLPGDKSAGATDAAATAPAEGISPKAGGDVQQTDGLSATSADGLPSKASQPTGASGVATSPWAQELASGGGLMGYDARQKMAEHTAETRLVTERGGLESKTIASQGRLLPLEEAMRAAGYTTETDLIGKRAGLESDQIAGKKSLVAGEGGPGAYGDLGTTYGSGIEMQQAMDATGQYLQNKGLYRSGVMPEVAAKRTAEIAERTEKDRRAELERSRALGYS